MSSVGHRKIWEDAFGKIPKDADGRSYEIHHIDGNHQNNELSNLKLVSIQEHYDIHYSQKDWGACFAISSRMNMTDEERSKIAKLGAATRLKNGTHNFQTDDHRERNSQIQTSIQQAIVKSGKHVFQRRADGSSITSDRVKDGTHPFLGGHIGGETSRRRVKSGTHHWLGPESNEKRIQEGTHNLAGSNNHNTWKISCLICRKVTNCTALIKHHTHKEVENEK